MAAIACGGAANQFDTLVGGVECEAIHEHCSWAAVTTYQVQRTDPETHLWNTPGGRVE